VSKFTVAVSFLAMASPLTCSVASDLGGWGKEMYSSHESPVHVLLKV